MVVPAGLDPRTYSIGTLHTQTKLNAIFDISDREKLYVIFREMFFKQKTVILNLEKSSLFSK